MYRAQRAIIVFVLLACVLTSCGGRAPVAPTADANATITSAAPTVTPRAKNTPSERFTATSVPTQPAAPELQPTSAGLETRVGIEEIDNVLDAVASADPETLRSLVMFTSAECTVLEGLGGPPKCRSGEAEGTEVQVLPFLGPEGSFIRKDEIENWQGIEASDLYAIYRVSPEVASEEYYPPGDVAIVFIGPENGLAVSLRLQEGRIVRVDYIFDVSSVDAIIQREAAEVILAPASR